MKTISPSLRLHDSLRSVVIPRPGSQSPTPDHRISPMLQLVTPATDPIERKAPKLFLVPTPQNFEGEEADPDYLPQPSSLAELPPLEETVQRFVVGVVEIWGGRRQPMQLARLSHRLVFAKIQGLAGNKREIPKIRKIYINQPIEGVAETTVTLRFNERIRSLVLRFEGVDKRWICTEFALL